MLCEHMAKILPISYGLVEDEVYELGADFFAELVLHVDEQLVAVEVAVGRDVDIVAESRVYVVDVLDSHTDS